MRRPAATDVAIAVVATVVVLVVLFSTASGPVSSAARVDMLARQLRCPTCSGLSIADSPATMASQMRAVVAEQVEAGASDDEVRAYFVDRYGRWVLLDPPTSGVDIAVWLVPVLLLSAGFALVVARARSIGSPSEPVPPVPRGRWLTAAAVSFAVIAIAVPVVIAVGPRLPGAEISGRPAGGDLRALEGRVAASPNDVGARTALGDAYVAVGRASEAVEQYRAALSLAPDDRRALLGVGVVLLDAGRPDAALGAFERILRRSPDDWDATFMRAVTFVAIDGAVSERARVDLERFLELAPEDERRATAEALLREPSASPVP